MRQAMWSYELCSSAAGLSLCEEHAAAHFFARSAVTGGEASVLVGLARIGSVHGRPHRERIAT
jgi:hypothetical protein